ncbi:hypothetical protein AB6C54_10290 [Vibrio splendidus]|uniref:hypothetical protein n=1 Tax=Vibrio splendidus TaxID=29497 RepID=UPI000D376117|nr:hypothetical protein [Vibrio splendidus]PTO58144.1 hypothetical protein CWN82_11455 [Vibrio splendidus]PTP03409.1 hypothetical protein CWN88_08375 [Vibrio splendidus]PTQ04563.1 hypothetical protein CWO28_13550 [Vibrio splendidus]
MNVIVDFIRRNNEHHVFNSEIVKYFDLLDDVIFYLDANSSSIEKIKDKNNVKLLNVENSKYYLWIKSNILLAQVLLTYGKRSTYTFLSATPLQYVILAVISKFFGMKVNVFMHGELGYLKKANGYGQKLGARFVELAFGLKSKVSFIAINAYIYDNLKNLYKDGNFIHIEHPIQSKYEPSKNQNDGLVFGTFGVQSTNKYSEKIYALSTLLSNDFYESNSLVTVGVSDGTFSYDCDDKVQHKCKGALKESLIPFDEFMNNVASIDCALFFNQNNSSYELTPSGVFSDCIALEKPIIAIKTNMLESYFKKYGQLGYLCKDLNEMAIIIEKIANNQLEINEIVSNLQFVKSELSSDYYIKNINLLL